MATQSIDGSTINTCTTCCEILQPFGPIHTDDVRGNYQWAHCSCGEEWRVYADASPRWMGDGERECETEE
jgi:hypothetical protein